jgi:hypothetical protein
MSTGYCKLFTDIVTSTIWHTPNDCRVLWVTMLALKDEQNICRATVPALAKICDITTDKCEEYLQQFQEPDKFSRSQEYDGRRIERVEGGYLILNGQKYRDMLRGQERRDYIRQKVAEHRDRVNKCKQSNQSKPIAEAEAQAKAEADLSPVVPAEESKVPESKEKVRRLTPVSNPECDAIYQAYPKKVAKKVALKAIAKAIKSFPADSILIATKKMGDLWKHETDFQYCPNPATWFNEWRFNDDPSTWAPHQNKKPSPAINRISIENELKRTDDEISTLESQMEYDWDRTPEKKEKVNQLKNHKASLLKQLAIIPR